MPELRTSLLASGVAKLPGYAPPVPTMIWRMPFGAATPFGSCGAKRS